MGSFGAGQAVVVGTAQKVAWVVDGRVGCQNVPRWICAQGGHLVIRATTTAPPPRRITLRSSKGVVMCSHVVASRIDNGSGCDRYKILANGHCVRRTVGDVSELAQLMRSENTVAV